MSAMHHYEILVVQHVWNVVVYSTFVEWCVAGFVSFVAMVYAERRWRRITGNRLRRYGCPPGGPGCTKTGGRLLVTTRRV
jgi:hypothetical protein